MTKRALLATPATTPADVLRAAARYIEHHGWTEDTQMPSSTNSCPPVTALGAITMVVHGKPTASPLDHYRPGHLAMEAACLHLLAHLGYQPTDPDTDLANWNFGADATEVVEAFNATADWYDRVRGDVR